MLKFELRLYLISKFMFKGFFCITISKPLTRCTSHHFYRSQDTDTFYLQSDNESKYRRPLIFIWFNFIILPRSWYPCTANSKYFDTFFVRKFASHLLPANARIEQWGCLSKFSLYFEWGRLLNFCLESVFKRSSYRVRAITHKRSLSNHVNRFVELVLQIHLHGPHQPELIRACLWYLLRRKEIHVAGVGRGVHQVSVAGSLPA